MSYFLGVVGGMGPAADILFQDIVREETVALGARTDQEHMPMAVLKNPAIPDRSAALSYGGPSPAEALLRTTSDLLKVGVQHIVWPCNTAHVFLPQVQRELSPADALKIHNMPAIAAACAPPAGTVLLATSGTVRSGIYTAAFAAQGKTLMLPSAEIQAQVHDLIYSRLKAWDIAGGAVSLLRIVQEFKSFDITHVLLGCSELPLAYAAARPAFDALAENYLDPMRLTARSIAALWHAYVGGNGIHNDVQKRSTN